jgi:hypothetical protein
MKNSIVSVEYSTGYRATTKFEKIADKTWRQGPVAAKITWRETNRDEWSVYLSRIEPNSGKEQRAILNLFKKEIRIYNTSGSYVKFSITNIAGTPGGGAPKAGAANLQNVARGKRATQSSTALGATASRAVDGVTDGNWNKNSVTHTNLEYRPWLQIDLGAVYDISEIKIYNRTDSRQVQDRLNNFWVVYSDSEIISNGSTRNGTSVKPFGSTGPLGASTQNPRILRQNAKNVRYIRIYLTGTNYLHLAEVQVFGVPSVTSAPTANRTSQNCSINDWAGDWNTNFNLISWKAQPDGSLKGTYNTQKHFVEARPVSGNSCELEGTWKHRGSSSQGRIKFTMNPDKRSFKGVWGSGNAVPGSNWSGTLKSRAVATATPTTRTPTPQPPVSTSSRTATGNRVNVAKCPEGNIPANDGECVLRIWFFPKPGVTLNQANSIARTNDWVLANRAQITEAWSKGVIDAYAFGMLSDGSLAVPVQKEFKTFKPGTNFNARGRADGFFMALKSAVKPLTAATRSSGGTAPVRKLYARRSTLQPVDYFRVEPDEVLFSPFHCQAGIGNLMIDGWRNASRPLLEEAGRMWLAKKKTTNNSVTLKQLEDKVRNPRSSNDVTRWEFAPLMLRIAWKALAAPRPTRAQLQFRKAFENYAACDENKLNRITLGMWNRHIGKGNDLSGNHWIGSVPPYKPALLSIVFTGDKPKTSEGFLPLENPLHLGARGKDAISLLYKPMMVKNIPDIDDRENLRSLDEEMTKTAVAVGLGSAFAGGAAFSTAVGVVPFQNILKKGKFTSQANIDIKIRNFEELVRQKPGMEGKTAAEVERIVAKESADEGNWR